MNQDSIIQAMREILDAIQINQPLDEILQLILKWSCALTGSVHGSFITVNHSENNLTIQSVYGPDWNNEIQSRHLKLGQGVTGTVALTGKPYLCHDTQMDPLYITWFDYVRCEMAVPIFVDKKIWGIINLDGTKPNEYNDKSLDQITIFAQLAASAIDLRLKWDYERRLQKELMESDKLSTLGKLIAGIAHEINNPLTAILGGASFLAYEVTDPEQKETLEGIAHEAQRAADLVKSLLAFSRRQPDQTAERPINDLVHEVCGLVRHQLKFKNIRLSVSLPEKSPLVNVNVLQIEQVLLNVLNNAVHAIEIERRYDGSIVIEVQESLDSVSILIKDNGVGMLSEVRKSIYDPFFTTKEVGKGTGLGLSLSQNIIQSHGGKISCVSGLHAGTTFTITLPLVTKDNKIEPKVSDEISKGIEADLISESFPLRILIVDDEQMIREGIGKFLKSQHHHVTLACDGQEGLVKIHESTFDVVISDVRMPRMSGLDLYRGVLEVDRAYQRRFIFITGDLIVNELIQKVRDTACPYLEKPFHFSKLLDYLPKERVSV